MVCRLQFFSRFIVLSSVLFIYLVSTILGYVAYVKYRNELEALWDSAYLRQGTFY